MILTVKTLKHVPLAKIVAKLPPSAAAELVEGLQQGEMTWGSNAETFITRDRLILALADAWEEYLDYHDRGVENSSAEAADLLGDAKKYNAVLAAVKKLPKTVFISLGG